jgi:glycerol-3-phosphate dehydrogenase
VAEKVTDLVLKKLGNSPVNSQTAKLPVYGGDLEGVDQFVRRAKAEAGQEVDLEVVQHLVQTYGTHFKDLLSYGHETQSCFERVCQQAPVIKAEIIHAIRKEMAQKLEDVIFRRTDLGTAGYPGDDCLTACAEIMASELGWSIRQVEDEIEGVKAVYAKRRVFQWGPLSATYVS